MVQHVDPGADMVVAIAVNRGARLVEMVGQGRARLALIEAAQRTDQERLRLKSWIGKEPVIEMTPADGVIAQDESGQNLVMFDVGIENRASLAHAISDMFAGWIAKPNQWIIAAAIFWVHIGDGMDAIATIPPPRSLPDVIGALVADAAGVEKLLLNEKSSVESHSAFEGTPERERARRFSGRNPGTLSGSS